MRGLRSKIESFYTSASDRFYDIVIIAETWLISSLYNSELFPPYYNVLRCDRNLNTTGRKTGGGVLIALADHITYNAVDVSLVRELVPLIDIIMCCCSVHSFRFFMIGVYIPPDVSSIDLEVFLEALGALILDKPVIIIGDFNLSQYSTNYVVRNVFCSKLNSFLDFSQTVNLSQYNNILNFNNRLLDLVLSNTDFKISVNLDQQSFVPPDPHHPALHIETEFLISSKLPRFPCDNNRRYNFRKANYNKLYNDLLHTDWSFLTNFEDANVALDHFYTKLYSILESSVPKFLPSKSSYPTWYNRQIISVLKLKHFYWKKWKKTSNMTFYNPLPNK